MRHDFVQTLNTTLETLDIDALDSRMAGLATGGMDLLNQAGVNFGGIDAVFELDMSYMGQTHTVDVALPIDFEGGATGVDAAMIHDAFEARYRHVYGRPLDGIAIRVLNLRVAVIGRRPKFDLSLLAPKGAGTIDDARLDTRQVWVDGAWHETALYERLALPVGAVVVGPALLEQPDTTIFIEPDLAGTVDQYGNIVIARKAVD
jgi:N-methylhydantoinase A